MKTRVLLIGCCMAAVLAFSGCRSAKEKGAPAEKEMKKETVSADITEDTASRNSTSGDTPAQSQNMESQSV